MEHQPTTGTHCVDVLPQALKADTTRIQFMYSLHQVRQGAAEAVELPHHQRVAGPKGKAYGVERECGITFVDDPRRVTLADFKLRKGEKFVYEYDMGDFKTVNGILKTPEGLAAWFKDTEGNIIGLISGM